MSNKLTTQDTDATTNDTETTEELNTFEVATVALRDAVDEETANTYEEKLEALIQVLMDKYGAFYCKDKPDLEKQMIDRGIPLTTRMIQLPNSQILMPYDEKKIGDFMLELGIETDKLDKEMGIVC